MISTLSEHSSFITVFVGNEVRLRDGHKSGTGEVARSTEKMTSVVTTDFSENETIDGSLNKEQVQATVVRLQELLKHVDPRIEISLEKDINQVIFRVVDKESGELIRQIPPENVVELDRFLSGHSGLFVEEAI